MQILGISAYYHDSAAAITNNGNVIAAAQEERFTRIKNDSGFPANAISYCLKEAKLSLSDLDYVGFYDKPLLTFDRLLETYFSFAPAGFRSYSQALPIWVKQKLFQKNLLLKELNKIGLGNCKEEKLLFGYHHQSHAASAFYPSPYDSAAILIMDGVGEWATTTLGRGSGTNIELMNEIRFPHSLGLLYAAFTYYLGFKINDGEYKVMGLAPYGEPKYLSQIYDNLIDIKNDGSFRLNMDYFNYCTDVTMTNNKFSKIFGDEPPRSANQPLTQRHMDIARSIQEVTENIVMKICRNLKDITGKNRYALLEG